MSEKKIFSDFGSAFAGLRRLKKQTVQPVAAEPATDKKEHAQSFHALDAAQQLQPVRQRLVISDIKRQSEDTKTFTLRAAEEGMPLASFVPGQHITLRATVDGNPVCRVYTLVSSPAQARQGFYRVTIKRQGFLSTWFVERAKVGDLVEATAPEGGFCCNTLQDANHVVAIAGGSGVAAFVSMAQAIADGDLDIRLTLLYTCPWKDAFLHKDDLDALANDKFRVRYYSPDCPDCSLMPLTRDELEKACWNQPFSVFYCGNPENCEIFEYMIEGMSAKPRSVRGGEESAWCSPSEEDPFTLKVKARTVTYTIRALPGETLVTAMERAGIAPPVKCRGGRCGFCRSRWLSGEYTVMPGFEQRTQAEVHHGWIHPCCTVPLSDMEIEIFPL